MQAFLHRYVAWIHRHCRAIIGVSLVTAAVATYIAAALPVYADFSHLLPPNQESVRHLRALEKRARVLGTLMLAVKSDDPVQRDLVARTLRDKIEALPADLAPAVTFDEGVQRRFGWNNRWLYMNLSDLERAYEVLHERVTHTALSANPLYVDFEDEPAPAQTAAKNKKDEDELADLRKQLHDAEAKKDDPGELVSKDGKLQMMILRTSYSSGDADKGTILLEKVRAFSDEMEREHPQVKVGLAGDIVSAFEEHRSILSGMLFSTCLTVFLVLGALLLYYRTLWGVGALGWSLAVGTVSAFTFTRLAIGHLNIATAFLSSIVVGNGINFGIMLLARFLEEHRRGKRGVECLTVAVTGTLHGTLAAALTAAVAYLSLIVTDFRGFRHFGIIGGAGMVLCWFCAYTLLPACLGWAEGRGMIRTQREPRIGNMLARLLPTHLQAVVVTGFVVMTLASVATWHYLSHDPYENNFRNLNSDSAGLERERHWMHEIDEAFGQGISGGFAVALPRREDTPALVARLRAVDEGKPEKERLFSRINTLEDMLPADQPDKMEVLGKIRDLMTDEHLAELSPEDRADALRIKPPADLRPLTIDDIPEQLAGPFIEADGSRGKLILAMSGWGYEIWNAKDVVRFAAKVRALNLGPDVLLGGMAFVFADMLALIEHDGPRATLTAALGAMLMVFLVVGLRRHAVITILCGISGTVLMLAMGSLLGVKVNFLDFVALPITIGIGIDYAVNICARDRVDGGGDARRVLTTAGGAVFLSSYTTIVGYGSLLLSANKGIRTFGEAAILGEMTCLVTALVWAPALLSVWHDWRNSSGRAQPQTT